MSYLTSDEFLASIEKGFEATTDLKPVPVPESLRYDPSDASLKRQLSFGFAQGDMTLGSIGRVFSSAYDSLTKGGSFKLNSELNNMQRQLDIKAEYPEFKNLSPEDYTAAMTVGEVSNYVFDPVLLAAYALVPGGMAARAAQFSAYEGGAEALRQVGRKGTVDDPVSVAVTASVAGVASLGLDKVFPYFKDKASKESKELIEEVIEEAEDVVNSAPILTQADHVRNWWKNALDETTLANQSQLATLRGRAAVGEDVSQADFVRAWYNSSKGGTDKTVKVEPTLTEGEEQIVRTSVANVKEPAKKVAFEDMNIQQRLISLSKVDLIINKLNQKLANPKILKNPAIYEKRLENALRHKESLQKNITVDMMNTAEKKAASFADTIDDIAEKGELSNKILSVLLAEATRPVVGATGGGVIGNMFDDDGDHNWTYYGMAAGAGFGFLSRRLNASPYLTEIQKETGDLIIGDAYKSLAGRTMAKLKIMTSSTLATKMDAAGGWTKAIGNKLFSRIGQGDANSVEFRVQQLHADFFEKLNSVVELPEVKKIVEQLGSLTEKNILKVTESNRTINTLAGEVMRGFIDAGSLKVGYKGIAGNLKPVTAEEIVSVRKAVVGYQEQMDYVKKLVENSGIRIKEDLGEDYGLPQLWDIDRASVEFVDFVEDLEVAIGIQVRNNGKKLNADNFAGSVTSKPAFRDNASFRGSQIFDVDPVSGLRTFRKAANYFENARQLTDQEAVKYLAQKGWLKLDAQEVLTEYGMQTIKVAEFAKTFGPNGELINLALNRIREAFKNQAKGLSPEAARKLSSERVNQENMLIDGVEAFWGRYGRPLQGEVGQTATTSIRTLQAMANMQYLSTVSIANLPDLLQPFINSNFGTAAKAAFAKPSERFSKLSNFKYDTTWEREILNFTSGGMIETRGQAFLANIQDIFFRGVGLKKVTQVARNFAYDVGANRAYSLANKIKVGKKLTKSEVNELKSLGLDGDNLKALSKYKNITEAFDDVQGGRVFLDIAGRISADRDAIIPLVGNRLLFTQHNNAAIRAMGQFLSWTMAKSAQLNKILSRVENGDARLALKMVSAIPIYGALREFKGMVNPGTAKDAYEDEDYLDKVLRSLKISGQTSYWAADKIAEGLKYNVSSRNNFTGGIAPAIGYLEESLKAIATASGKDNFQEAAKEVGETVPIVSQAIDIAEKYSKGGEVFVPNAPIEPDERIDKMTGLPYDVQAGIPFIDEEDPLKRLGLVGGGSVAYVDPLQRMGFGLGGAVTKLVKSFTKLSGDDATGTFETVAAKELADATPDGSVDDVAKSLTGKTVDDVVEYDVRGYGIPLNNLSREEKKLRLKEAREARQKKNIESPDKDTSKDTSITSDTSYRLSHQPSKGIDDETVRLDDLTKSISGVRAGYPEDFYTAEGKRIYAPGPNFKNDMYGKANNESYEIIKSVRDKPEEVVTIYRAVPKGITKINEGDFVTLSPTYAKQHSLSGYGRMGDEEGEVIKQKVKVKDLIWANDDPNEFGYFPNLNNVDETRFGLFGSGKKDAEVKQTVDTIAEDVDTIAEDLVVNTEGKELKDVVSYVGSKSAEVGREDYKVIAKKVAAQLDNFEKEGFSFNYEITRLKKGSDRDLEKPAPAALVNKGAAGIAQSSNKDKRVDVYINDLNTRDSLSNGLNYETILHESIHAATMSAIKIGNLKSQAGTKLSKDVQDLYSLFNHVIKQFNKKAKNPESLNEFESKVFKRLNNTLQNPDEIVSWGLTNSGMQKYLEGIKYGNTNAWTSFVTKIREILGLSSKEDTALSELLRVSDELLSADVKQVTSVMEDLTKKNSGDKVLKSLSKGRLADEKPTRDYSDLTLKTREDQLTEIFLKEHNYTEIDSLTETIKNQMKEDGFSGYIVNADNSITAYTPVKGSKKGFEQKTFRNPTLKSLRTWMGY